MAIYKKEYKISDDSLATYLKEISKIEPLSKEEEMNLGKKIQKGHKKSLDELVKRNLKYVVSVANKYKGCGLSLLDLINEGNIGLIQAAKRYDPSKNVKFITYAVWWIRQAIMHTLAEQAGTVRLPIKQAGVLYKISGKYRKLFQKNKKEPTTDDLAKELNLPPEEVESILRVYRNYLSLNAPLKNNDETHYLDLIGAKDSSSLEEGLIKKSLRTEVNKVLSELSSREEKILKMRFGFDDGEAKTLEEIGKEVGLSRERIRQIEKKAKEKLRLRTKTRVLRDYLN